MIFLVVLLIVLYFVLTSSLFLANIALPLAGRFADIPMSANKVKISFFHHSLKLEGVKIGYKNAPFVEGKEITCKFKKIFSLFNGNIALYDICLNGVTFRTVRYEDGQWNYPWLNWPVAKVDTSKGAKQVAASDPVLLDLANIKAINSSLVFEIRRKLAKDSSKIEIKNLTLNSALFKNNSRCGIKYSGSLTANSGNSGNIVKIQNSKVLGIIDSQINGWLTPEKLNSSLTINNIDGKVNNAALQGREFNIHINALLTDLLLKINDFQITEKKESQILSSIGLKGNVIFDPLKVNLELSANPVSSETLNLFSGIMDNYNLGETKLYYTGNVNYSEQGMNSAGNLVAKNISMSTSNYKSPKNLGLDLSLDYGIGLNFTDKTGEMKKLKLELINEKNRVVNLSLLKPFPLGWGKTNVKDILDANTKVRLEINQFRLSLLNPFIPNEKSFAILSGTANGGIDISLDQTQKMLNFSGDVNLADLAVKVSGDEYKNIDTHHKFNLALKNFSNIIVDPYLVELEKDKENVCRAILKGNYNFKGSNKGRVEISVPSLSSNVLSFLPKKDQYNKNIVLLKNLLDPFNVQFDSKIDFTEKKSLFSVSAARIKLDNKNEKVEAFLKAPLHINLKQKFAYDKLKAGVQIDNLDLSLFNNLLPSQKSLIIKNGRANGSLDCFVDNLQKEIGLVGTADLSSLNFESDGKTYHNLGLKNDLVCLLKNNSKFDLNKVKTTITVGNEEACVLSTRGDIDFSRTAYSLNANIISLNEKLWGALPNLSNNIKKFAGEGKISIKSDKGNFALVGDIRIPTIKIIDSQNKEQVIPITSGSINIDLSKTQKKLKLTNLLLKCYNGNTISTDISTIMDIPLPVSSGRSSIVINSDKLNGSFIEMLQAILKSSNKNDKTVKTKSDSEKGNDSVLRKTNLIGKINLNAINYNYLTDATSLKSDFTIKHGILRAIPILIVYHSVPAQFDLLLNFNNANIYAYSIKGGFKKLPMLDLLKAFDIKNYYKARGKIDNFYVDLKGEGTPFIGSSDAKLNGYIKSDMSNLTLPYDMKTYGIFRLLFIPIEIFSNLNNETLGALRNSKSVTSSAVAIFKKLDVITLRKGEVYIVANGNYINLQNVGFYGGPDDLVKEIKLEGNIETNGDLKITTNSNLSGVAVPLEIYGTISNPRPELGKFAIDFIRTNAAAILNPDNPHPILNDAGETLQNTVEGTINFLKDSISNIRKSAE